MKSIQTVSLVAMAVAFLLACNVASADHSSEFTPIADANEGLPSATQSKQSYVRKAKAEKKKSKKPEQDGPTTTEPKPITISEALLRPESDSGKRKGKN